MNLAKFPKRRRKIPVGHGHMMRDPGARDKIKNLFRRLIENNLGVGTLQLLLHPNRAAFLEKHPRFPQRGIDPKQRDIAGISARSPP
jgi:hypothetical protein